MLTDSNFYDLLGLPQDATPEEIRRAYHEAARKLHPDVNKQVGAAELFLQIQKAYEILSSNEDRGKYDEHLERDGDQLVSKKIIFSRPTIPIIDEPQLIYSLLEFSAVKQAVLQPKPPINVCLVIDRSTSMQGERMDTVKLAATELIRQLRAEDLLAIVVFSDRAEVLLSSAQRLDRASAETHIRMLRSSGGTEIFQGLEAGLAEVHRNVHRTSINHIILLTDGRTYGDEDDCLQLADAAAQTGIRITALGIGTEWNDAFIDELAARTGGSSHYISKAADIQRFLKERFNSFGQIYADQVALDIKLGDGVLLNSAFRLQPDVAVLTATSPIRLGQIPRISKLAFLLEFVVAPIPSNTTRVALAAGELNMKLVSKTQSMQKLTIKLTRLIGSAIGTELPPRPIFHALSQITLYRMQERARKEVKEGKTQEATTRLQRLASQLTALGERELAQTAILEAERIQRTHSLSAEGEKTIKYGTRSLLLPASIETEEEIV